MFEPAAQFGMLGAFRNRHNAPYGGRFINYKLEVCQRESYTVPLIHFLHIAPQAPL